MSRLDPMDFQPNSAGVMVVRVIRLEDVMKALRCTEEKAKEVVKEIRGEASEDGSLAFVLPSQLAAWAYKRAGKPLAPLPYQTVLVNNPSSNADALKRAAVSSGHSNGARAERKKLILSKREAARLLGVSRTSTLNEMIARGLLKTVLVNGHVKVARAEVEKIAAEGFDVTGPVPHRRIRRSEPRESKGESVSDAIRRIRI